MTILSIPGQIRTHLSVQHREIGMSLLRIALGINILFLYAVHAFQYQFIWGNNGIVPYSLFLSQMTELRSWSIYELSGSDLFGMAVFGIGLLVTVLFTVGLFTRLSTVAFYIFTWSLYCRNEWVLDGGDNLLYLLAFYMMFADCGRYFSIDSALSANNPKRPPSQFASLLHNVAVFAIVMQLCIVYFTSAFYKIQGHMWQDGTALYYILRTAEFNLTLLGKSIYANSSVVSLLTYATIIFQIGFPFLIWNRYAKVVVFCGALCLHLSIAFVMGLFWFSMVMISAELAIFSDSDYVAFSNVVKEWWTEVAQLRRLQWRSH